MRRRSAEKTASLSPLAALSAIPGAILGAILGAVLGAIVSAPEPGLAQEPDRAVCGPVVTMRFYESSPRDFVTVRNESPAGWRLERLSWRLAGSAGDLVFDTAPGGAGYSVAQSFLDGGGARLLEAPEVADGSQTLDLTFDGFVPGDDYDFSIDLDDQVTAGATIDGSEIAGAEVEAVLANPDGFRATIYGVFDNRALARLEAECSS